MSLAAEKRRKAKDLEETGAALSVKLIARSTRGQRISELQGEDAEADETFWGQGAWQEAEDEDSEFSTEEEEPDKFDKDFNDSESEDGDDDDKEETTLRKNERAAKRKRPAGGVYKEPKRFVTVKRKPAVPPGSSSHTAVGGVDSAEGSGGAGSTGREPGEPIKRSVRASTKTKTEKSFKVREGEAKAREAQLKQSAPQSKTLKGQFTQKRLLLEAIQTEQENMRWILKQQRLEDEAKEDEARPKQNKTLASRYVSRRGCVDTIFFPDAFYLPPVLCQPPAPTDSGTGGKKAGSGRPAERLCKITGSPARYKDPLTGYDYASAAAFRELRKRYGASARQQAKAQQEEKEENEAASRGGASAGATGPTGSRQENGVAAVVAGAGAGTAGGIIAAAGAAAGNGSSKGPGACSQAGGQSSGQGKKQGSSKDTEKKSKSSSGKGKGKAKGVPKGTAAAAKVEGSTAPSSGENGAGQERQEKSGKANAKRPRKQGATAKGSKPAKRPFFAPAPEAVAAPVAASLAGHEEDLVPLKGNTTAHRGDAVQHVAPLPVSTHVAGDALPKTAACGQITVVTAGAEAMPSALVNGAASSASLYDAAPVAAAVQVYNGVSATAQPETGAPLIETPDVVEETVSAPPALAVPPADGKTAPGHNELLSSNGGVDEVVNGWELVGSTSATQKLMGWQQPVEAGTVPGRPPG